MISAVVLTLNEENILERCLNALDFVSQVYVMDSYSCDKTIEIAENFGAIVIQRKFDNYANQRNAALDSIPNIYDWVLMVDADEIVTDTLRDEILEKTSVKGSATMFRVRRKDMFQGKWLKYSSGYPTWLPRLFQNGTVTVAREINEEYVTSGDESFLNGHLMHYPFNKGLKWWLHKHNNYSEAEAQLMLSEINEPIPLKHIFSINPVIRRKVHKRISYHFPFRPFLVFMGFYFLKGGFLDGRAGYSFCTLRRIYESMIDIKIKDLKLKSKIVKNKKLLSKNS